MLVLNTRNNEAAMLVLQNNAAKQLRLIAADKELLKIIALDDGGADDVDFLQLLAKKHQQYITEELQYDSTQKDLLEIMHHMQQLNFYGCDEAFTFHMVRELPQGKNDVFRIILLQSNGKQQKYELLNALQQNMAGHEVIDAMSGLPDASSILQFVELARNYSDIEMAFVHVKITPSNLELQNVIAQAIRRNVRKDDIVGVIDKGEVAILLADVNMESANLAINRLRTALQRDPLLVQNRISYHLRFAGVAINSEKNANETTALAKKMLASDATKDVIIMR